MQTILSREFRMEGEREQVVLTDRDRVPIDVCQHCHFRPVLGDPGGTDEDRVDRPAGNAGDLEVGFKRVQLTAERVALRDHIEDPQVSPVEHDHAGARTENRLAGGGKRTQGIAEPFALDAERHHRRLAAGHHQRVKPVEVSRDPDLARARAKSLQHLLVRCEAALEGENSYEWT